MANDCTFLMRIKGSPENVDTFVELIQADYYEVPRHFWRVFSIDICNEETEVGVKTVDVCGCCAWSVHTCMRDGEGTYNQHSSDGTTLSEQSELLSLDIEVYSTEPGVGFQEHYLYKNGRELIDDCVEYHEYYFENENDFNQEKELGYYNDYTWSDVDEYGYIKVGGFDSWKFVI